MARIEALVDAVVVIAFMVQAPRGGGGVCLRGNFQATTPPRLAWILSARVKRVDPMKRTESAFSKLGGEYLARKKFSEGKVREWKWASWCWYEIQPLYFERHGWAPGRTLREPPSNPDKRVECGL